MQSFRKRRAGLSATAGLSCFQRYYHYLGIGANRCLAVLTSIGKQGLVALDAERLFIAQNVAISGQVEVAVETGEHRRVRLHDVTDLRLEPPTLGADLASSPSASPALRANTKRKIRHNFA